MTANNFNVGDTVQRILGAGGPRGHHVVSEVRTAEQGTPAVKFRDEQYQDWHFESNLELISRAERDMSQTIEVGDTVARLHSGGSNSSRNAGEEFVVARIDPSASDHDYDDLYEADGQFHYRRNVRLVRKANAEVEQLADWERELLEGTPEVTRPYRVGDIISLNYTQAGNKVVTRIRTEEDGVEWKSIAPETETGWDRAASLTLVTAAREPGVHGFAPGDLVRTRAEYVRDSYRNKRRDQTPWVVASLDSDGWPTDETGSYYVPDHIEHVNAPDVVAPRKLGETPEGDHIAINDPRIEWIWKDLGEYAEGKRWCREYEELAAVLGIPGRKQKFNGYVHLRGASIYFENIEADTVEEARLIFHQQLISDLTPVNTDAF